MVNSGRMLTFVLAAAFVCEAARLLPAADASSEFRFESIGARVGIGANNSSVDFHKAEAVLNFHLPSDYDLGRSWNAALRLDTTAGWFGDPGHNAFIASAGPSVVFGRLPIPFTIEGGISPTVITRWEFGGKDFGTPIQFISHVALNAEMGPSFRLYYRLEHMSNGGLASHNPGLNLHMLGFSYVF